MKKLNIAYFCLLLSVFLLAGCSSGNKRTPRTDTPTTGVARIVVDECLAPIVQQQIDVFEPSFRYIQAKKKPFRYCRMTVCGC